MTQAHARQTLVPGQKALVIGAGISGLTAAKALADHGIPYDHVEMGADLGGLWRFENDNGRSAAYRTLHINSSKYNMELEDFSIPDDFPVFGHHTDVLQYFEDYADAFGLRASIAFHTAVERVEPASAEASNAESDSWCVTFDSGETRTYGAVLVATGHHWKPRMPSFPGAFDGRVLHAHDYRTPEAFAGTRVLVVGIGNSACDVVVDLCRIADDVTLSTRSSAWVLPKYVLGIPLDQWTSPWMESLPLWVRRPLFRLLVWLSVGDQERYGLPTPDHKLMQEHPTISQELLAQIGHGRVRVKPNVERLEGEAVRFEDGTTEPFDAVIYATGYDVAFPFLPDDVFHVEDNRVRLYRSVVPPDRPGLYFMGLLQPLGAIMPLVEKQAKWVAALLDGDAALPDRETMEATIQAHLDRMRRRYVDSPRHTLQVDFWDYVHRLDREMKQGRKRAARQASARAG